MSPEPVRAVGSGEDFAESDRLIAGSSYHFVIAVWRAKERISMKAPMAIHKNAASKEKKRMSVETINSLAWWFGGAAVLLACLAAIAGAVAWYLSSESSERLSNDVQSMQQPVAFTAKATLKVKNAGRFDPARPERVYQALLHVGNSTRLNERPGGHLFFLNCENVKIGRSQGEEETYYDLIFQDGGKTKLANSLTVDELLHESDAAVVTAWFLLPNNVYEVLGGQITVVVNATKTKHFSIPPQKVEGWFGIYATAD